MKTNHFFSSAAKLGLATIAGTSISCAVKNPTDTKPNVVMIVVDDMNTYGTQKQYPLVKTPYLDKLRGESVHFVNAVCNTPVSNPSRSCFFSGLYPHTTGAYLNGSDGWNRSELLEKIRSIPECFKDNGYTTWARGKIFHNRIDSAREAYMFDNRPIYQGGFGPFPEEEYWLGGNRFSAIKPWTEPDTDFPDVLNANAAIEFLQEDHDKPFFLYYGLWRPHTPYTAPKRFFDMYNEDEIVFPEGYRKDDLNDVPFLGRMLVDSLKKYHDNKLPFETVYKKFLLAYCANTSFADWNVGRVIEALDNSNYAHNTIIVFFSDNGYHCGEKERWEKATLWDQADIVPFMVRTPEKKSGESKATIGLVDVYPTIIDYCKLNSPDQPFDGKSFARLIEDPDASWDRPSITSYGINYSSVRNEQYRYIQYPDGTEELYDHSNDPHEFTNIINDASKQTVIEELKKEIPDKWAKSLGGKLEVERNRSEVMREATPWDK